MPCHLHLPFFKCLTVDAGTGWLGERAGSVSGSPSEFAALQGYIACDRLTSELGGKRTLRAAVEVDSESVKSARLVQRYR